MQVKLFGREVEIPDALWKKYMEYYDTGSPEYLTADLEDGVRITHKADFPHPELADDATLQHLVMEELLGMVNDGHRHYLGYEEGRNEGADIQEGHRDTE